MTMGSAREEKSRVEGAWQARRMTGRGKMVEQEETNVKGRQDIEKDPSQARGKKKGTPF